MSLVLSGSNYAYRTTPVNAYPKTILVWFKTSDVSQSSSNAIMVSDDDGSNKQNQCQLRGDQSPNYPIAVASYNSGWAYTFCASPYPQNSTWHCAVVVFTSDNNREVYLDGASYAQTTTSQAAGSTTHVSLGCRYGSSSPGVYYTGQLAHFAMWDIALSGAEIASLAAGTNPQDIQYANLQAHHILGTDGTDEMGGATLTEVSSPSYTGDDPPVDPPGGGSTEYVAVTFTGTGSMIVAPNVTYRPVITFSGEGVMTIAPDSSSIYNVGTLMDDPDTADGTGWDAGIAIGGISVGSAPRPQEMAEIPGLGSDEHIDQTAMDQNEHTGGEFDAIDAQWFEHAHLIPRTVQALGNIISATTINCELYNADRNDAITVSSITSDLATGVTVTGVPATPFNIDSQSGLQFIVNVGLSGGFGIDSTYTLTLSTGEEYTITITGTRIVLLPIRPESPLREHIQFDTKIIEKINGTEQRTSGRQYPRGMFEMSISEDRRRMELFLYDRQSKIVAVPAWHEPSFLTSAAVAGTTTTINVNTTSYANFYVGGYVVVLTDKYTYDTREIVSMTSTTIELDSAVTNSHAIGTQVMPLMAAYVEPTTPSVKSLNNDQQVKLRVYTLATENDIADTGAWNTFGGKVLLDGPNVVDGSLEEVFETRVYTRDNTTGVFSQYDLWGHSKRNSVKGFVTKSRQELWELRQLLHSLKGRWVTFYIPTFSKDLLPNQDLSIGSTALIMDNVGYALNAYQRESKKYIRVHLVDGTVLDREITASVENSTAEEQITVDAAWPYDIAVDDINRIEFLSEVRLDTDDIVLIHYNALGQSKCMVAVKEVIT